MPKETSQTWTTGANDLVRNKRAKSFDKSMTKLLAKYNKLINTEDANPIFVETQYKNMMLSAKKIAALIREYEKKEKLSKGEDKLYQRLKVLWDQAYQFNQFNALTHQRQEIVALESKSLPDTIDQCNEDIDLISDYMRNRREAAARIHYGYADLLSDLNEKNQSFITNPKVTDHLNLLLAQYKETLTKLKLRDEVMNLSARMQKIKDATISRYDIPAYASFHTIIEQRKAGFTNTIRLIDPVLQGKHSLHQYSTSAMRQQFKQILNNENEFFKLMDSVNQVLNSLDLVSQEINKNINDKTRNAIFNDVLKRRKLQLATQKEAIISAMNDFDQHPDKIVAELNAFAKSGPSILADLKRIEDRFKSVVENTNKNAEQGLSDIDLQVSSLEKLSNNRAMNDRYGMFLSAQKKLLLGFKSNIQLAINNQDHTKVNYHSKAATQAINEIKESLEEIGQVELIFNKALRFTKNYIDRYLDEGETKQKALKAVAMLQRQKVGNLRDLNSIKRRFILEMDLFPQMLAKQIIEKVTTLQNEIQALSENYSAINEADRLIKLTMLSEYINQFYDADKRQLRENFVVAFALAQDPSVREVYSNLIAYLTQVIQNLPTHANIAVKALRDKVESKADQNEVFTFTLEDIESLKAIKFTNELSIGSSKMTFFEGAKKDLNNKPPPKPLPKTPKND